MDEYILRLRSRDSFALLGELDEYDSLTYTRRYQSLGAFQLVVHNDNPLINAIRSQGTVVEILRNGVQEFTGRIKYRSVTLTQDSEKGFKWTLQGPDMGDNVYTYLALPGNGQLTDTFSGSGGAAMRHFVDFNAGQSAAPARRIQFLQLGGAFLPGTGPTQGWALQPADPSVVGDLITQAASYSKVGDLLTQIGQAANCGFRFRLDPDHQLVLFDVYRGGNRTETGWQAANLVPAIFSVGRDTLKSFQYEDDGLNASNVVYAGGTGSGLDRPVLTQSDSASVSALGAREAYVDARNAQTTSALQTQATQFLNANSRVQRISFQPIDGSILRYRQDWDVGDSVTLRCDEAGVEADLPVLEVTVTLQPDRPPELSITVGRHHRSLIRQLRSHAASVQASLIQGSVISSGMAAPTTAAQSIGAGTITAGTGADIAAMSATQSAINSLQTSTQAAVNALKGYIDTNISALKAAGVAH